MVVVFANNQTLVTVQGSPTTVYTDPVTLGNNDRLSAILNVHSIVKGGLLTTVTLDYVAQVSNDGGQTYINSTSVTDSVTATGAAQKVGTVNGALVRFKYTLTATGGTNGDFAGCCFDLHVNFDHA